jgi:hypothetical protein
MITPSQLIKLVIIDEVSEGNWDARGQTIIGLAMIAIPLGFDESLPDDVFVRTRHS